MCFVWISEQTAIISLYNINGLVCITETERVYCAVRTVFMCLLWISEQTAIISKYIGFITETECLLCGTSCIFKHNSGLSLSFQGLIVSIDKATTQMLLVPLKRFKF
jgi:hypothetical protein